VYEYYLEAKAGLLSCCVLCIFPWLIDKLAHIEARGVEKYTCGASKR
jgi:hypothetical protein